MEKYNSASYPGVEYVKPALLDLGAVNMASGGGDCDPAGGTAIGNCDSGTGARDQCLANGTNALSLCAAYGQQFADCKFGPVPLT